MKGNREAPPKPPAPTEYVRRDRPAPPPPPPMRNINDEPASMGLLLLVSAILLGVFIGVSQWS